MERSQAVPGLKLYSFEFTQQKSTPDLHGVTQDGSFWIEVKRIEGKSDVIPWRSGQQKWLLDYYRAGGRGFLMVFHEHYKGVYLFPGSCAGLKPCLTIRDIKVACEKFQRDAHLAPLDQWVNISSMIQRAVRDPLHI